MMNSPRRLRVTGDGYLDGTGMELVDRGVTRAAIRTTLPREKFGYLRVALQAGEYSIDEKNIFVVSYDGNVVADGTASLAFELLAKELALLGNGMRITNLNRLSKALEHDFDENERNILHTDNLFIRDFFLVGHHGLPLQQERMYEVESFLFERLLNQRTTFLFTHGVAVTSNKLQEWWSSSLLSYLREFSKSIELEPQE
jgi:hypothetical protein